MALSADLLLRISRKYEPSVIVDFVFRGNDVALHLIKKETPLLCLLVTDGRIRGKRYSRTLKKDQSGKVIKDHWDLKGTT